MAHRWGMAADLDRCTGCGACVTACHAENNIPTVGPEQAARGRAMHWIRVERYWEGDFPDVRLKFRPVMCQQCDAAPCEPVCPTYASHHTEGLDRTVLVVSSKSGGTVETDSQRRTFEQAFREAGTDPARRIVVVTDPGSPLEKTAADAGYRAVFNADPHVGGRYSALTAFGLVPSGLAGADGGALLDEADGVSDLLSADDQANPALFLGAALGGTDPLRDKIVFVDEGSGIPGFGDWAEHLIAESTGKEGKGLLPVVTEGPQAPEASSGAADVLVVRLVSGTDDTDPEDASAPSEPTGRSGDGVSVAGPLGAQVLLWEYAVAIAGRLLGINP